MLIVTATDLPRLMACNGSRLMAGFVPVVERDDTVRQEGNAAHWLAEQVHNAAFTAVELVDRKAPNGIYITPDMVEYLDEYLAMAGVGEIETDTSYAGDGWQVNGRADRIRYDALNYTLYIDDLKYGWSIVEPMRNWTLISHAVGWMNRHAANNRVDRIVFTVYQPRPHHATGRVRSWEINEIALTGLAIQIQNTLSNPNDQLHTGEHCYRCPALTHCVAARKAQMNAIDATETAFVDNIDNDNLSFQLDHLTRAMEVLKNMYNAYSDLATHRLREGQIVQNYSLDNELTNRQWKDGVTPDLIMTLTGKDVTKKQIITPAQAEKTGVIKEVVAALTERRNKGVKLVRIDANARAQKAFNPNQPKGK